MRINLPVFSQKIFSLTLVDRNRLNKRYLTVFICLLLFISHAVQAQTQHEYEGQTHTQPDVKIVEITPSEVFTETIKVHEELALLKDFFHIHYSHEEIEKNDLIISGDFKPKHVWQLIYLIQVKLNLWREKYYLPRIEEVGMEPVLNVSPNMPYGMLQRLLTEIRIIKSFFAITEQIPEIEKNWGKTPTDVFNALLHLSLTLDYINEQAITPSSVFAQVMRLYQDTSVVLQILNIDDDTNPPAKNEHSTPEDAYSEVERFIKQLNKLQLLADIPRTSFSSLRKQASQKKFFTPEYTFILVAMANAELQTIKAYLGLSHMVTPPAQFYADKTPADVEQLMNWTTRRLNLIKDLEVDHVK